MDWCTRVHPRMYVGGVDGGDGRNGPLPRARLALLCHWERKGGGGGREKGLDFCTRQIEI